MNRLSNRAETVAMIEAGKRLLLAGDEAMLASLPSGAWIGGTIPYFMTEEGGLSTTEKIFVTVLPEVVTGHLVRVYEHDNLALLANDHPGHGFSILLLPAFSEIHASFAENVTNYSGIFDRPLVGWISGVALSDIGKVMPKVFDGTTGLCSATQAVVLHVELPEDHLAMVDIVNPFPQGSGPAISFARTGFSTSTALIDGVPTGFAAYIAAQAIDTRLPLVADYHGALINVSIQSIDADSGQVSFYAPVFSNVTYRFAEPIEDYADRFISQLQSCGAPILFSCNCVLNYLYGELAGKRTGSLTGPMTFGEIAYILLNQTAIYLTVYDTSFQKT
jgi:hypothetical protein